MIQIEKHSMKELTAVFSLAFIIGCLLFGWLEWSGTPISYWPIGVDIYPRWVGSRAFWQGDSPYSKEVDNSTQIYVYGRLAEANEDPFGFYYPAHTAIVLAPLTLLPAHWAALLWTAAMWACVALIVFLVIQNISIKTPPWLWILIALSIFLFRPALISVINGQYTLFILTIWGAAYFLIQRKRYLFAGFLLALTTIKPSLSFFPLLVFLIWAFRNKRPQVLISFMITSALFFILSIIKLGWWAPDFFAELAEYDAFPRYWVMGNIFSWSGAAWLVITIVLLYMGIKIFRQENAIFPWVLFWGAISLNLLVTPHTVEYDLVILILPFLIGAPKYLQTKSGVIIWLFVLWFPWLYFFFLSPLGEPTNLGLSNIWTYYPQMVMAILLVSIHLERKTANTIRTTLPV